MSAAAGAVNGMKETNAIFVSEVVEKRNYSALDRVYTADATILPPGAPMIQGSDAIKAFWKQAIEGLNATGGKLESVRVDAVGDTIVEIGKAELVAGGQIASIKYVVHWKQEQGLWKWHVDIWNMNQ